MICDRGATISECRKYRYRLWRLWDETLPTCCFVMLNPSTADHLQDDPTIRRCIGFAKRFGCGRLDVVNLFAFRATNPRELLEVADPIGEGNSDAIADATRFAEIIVAAWGVNGTMQAKIITSTLRDCRQGRVKCLGKTKHGHPRHPLYLSKGAQLEPYP